MRQDEFGHGAGIARQQLAVGPPSHAVVRRLNGFLGRNALLMRGRRSADADQAGDLRDLESGVAVEQKMAEQTAGIIIVATALAESKGVLQQAALLGRQALFANLRLGNPLGKSAVRGNHEKTSLPRAREDYSRKDQRLTVRARKTVWC